MVELPDDEVEAVAQAAVAAVRAGGSVREVAEAMLPELRLIAARVRAEAAADERRRLKVIEWEAVVSKAVQGRRPSDTVVIAGAVRRALSAAGSVPVATPMPEAAAQRTQSEVRGTARGSGAYAELEASRAPDPARQSPRRRHTGEPVGPVATPTEPRGQADRMGGSIYDPDDEGPGCGWLKEPDDTRYGCQLPGGHSGKCEAASPVPTEPPPRRKLAGWFDVTEPGEQLQVPVEQPEPDLLGRHCGHGQDYDDCPHDCEPPRAPAEQPGGTNLRPGGEPSPSRQGRAIV